MFFNAPGNPSRLKRVIYLSGATILGVILSFIAHAFIEIGYLRWAESHSLAVSFYNGCALLPTLQIALLVFGAIGGFLIGQKWWHIVYID